MALLTDGQGGGEMIKFGTYALAGSDVVFFCFETLLLIDRKELIAIPENPLPCFVLDVFGKIIYLSINLIFRSFNSWQVPGSAFLG